MTLQQLLGQQGAAVTLALLATACGAATSGPGPEVAHGAWTPEGQASAEPPRPAKADPVPPPSASPQDPRSTPSALAVPEAPPVVPAKGEPGAPTCPYGSLEDPHRGFVRCLLPEERGVGWVPAKAGALPLPESTDPETPGSVPLVEVGAPKFENGEVPRVEKVLGKASADIAKCVGDHGGLTGDAGTLKVQFLVRARARAEGVEVVAAKGVSKDASTCVRKLLKNKVVGAPTSDPVGVTVVIALKPGK